MKYYDILKLMEAKQVGILYHYTSIENAIQILWSNTLRPGEHDGVSFTRNKHFHETEREEIATGVKFIVNGDKLSEKYKIEPFNYFWNRDQAKASPDQKYLHYDYYDEQEELVKAQIDFFLSYVIKIEIDRHHADCFFDGFEIADSDLLEMFPNTKSLMKFFNEHKHTEWAK